MNLVRRPPFPGMDPWLEHPARSPGLHTRLTVAIADALAPLLQPHYYVEVEVRTTILTIGEPERLMRPDLSIWPRYPGTPPSLSAASAIVADVNVLDVVLPIEDEIEESFLEVRDLQTHDVVTVIEVLSPTNKIAAEGRKQYLAKRDASLRSSIGLVEIDLLRAGYHMPSDPLVPANRYSALVSRSWVRPRAQVYVFSYLDSMPTISVPLRPGETEPELNLTEVTHALFERARYFYSVDYGEPPIPPLRPEDRSWAEAIIRQATEA